MNPFAKYLKGEDLLHVEIVNYIRLQYPSVLFWHTQNEGKKSKFEQYKFKLLGCLHGVSDLILIHNKKLLALELKSQGNKPTKYQEDFLYNIAKNGFTARWADNFEQAKMIIDEWYKQ